ncbi:MAG: PEP/pyruvate-binding domain-containing protein, partial [Bacteroidia bacterium]
MNNPLIIPYDKINNTNVSIVGGKNASLGEMIKHLQPLGINIPDGFATTSDVFRLFLSENKLNDKLNKLLDSLDKKEFSNLNTISKEAKALLLQAALPLSFQKEIIEHYNELCKKAGRELDVAVRSSATAEDLPTASFAGQHDSYLNVKGTDAVVKAVQNCFASLYNARAIKYRVDNGFDHSKVALSAGVQLMVRSDLSSSGVCFTIEPDSGFKNVIVITGCWGLGENIVQGAVTPDEFHVFKPFINKNKLCIISKKLGSKAKTMIYENGTGTINTDTAIDKQKTWTLNNDEITMLAQWASLIEKHYQSPMDIEWAKDGKSGKLYIVQARPETVHSSKDPMLVK